MRLLLAPLLLLSSQLLAQTTPVFVTSISPEFPRTGEAVTGTIASVPGLTCVPFPEHPRISTEGSTLAVDVDFPDACLSGGAPTSLTFNLGALEPEIERIVFYASTFTPFGRLRGGILSTHGVGAPSVIPSSSWMTLFALVLGVSMLAYVVARPGLIKRSGGASRLP